MKFLVMIRVLNNDLLLITIVMVQDLDKIGSRTLTKALGNSKMSPKMEELVVEDDRDDDDDDYHVKPDHRKRSTRNLQEFLFFLSLYLFLHVLQIMQDFLVKLKIFRGN
jgi:hypothetical protein